MKDSNVNKIDNNAPKLTLFQMLVAAQSWFEKALMPFLEKEGESRLGYADLKLLAHLNCGTTYASELARRMGVSRQAVNKLTKNLVQSGLVRLEAVPGRRNAKWIVITDSGGKIIRDIVTELNRMEALLETRIGENEVAALRNALEADWGIEEPGRSTDEPLTSGR